MQLIKNLIFFIQKNSNVKLILIQFIKLDENKALVVQPLYEGTLETLILEATFCDDP